MKVNIYLILFIGLFLSGNLPVFTFAQEKMEQEYRPEGKVEAEEAKKEAEGVAAPTVSPIIQINRLETKEPLYSFELRDVEIRDLFRVLAHDYKLNLLIDKDVEGKITASLTNVSLEEALETIAESQNLILEKKGNIIKVRPNLVTQTFTLKYIEAKKLLESQVQAQAGAQAQAEAAQAQEIQGASAVKQAHTIYELLSHKGKILLGKQPNSIMIIDYPQNIKKIEEYLNVVDRRMTSRVFKLKYLKATDVVGQTSTDQGQPAAAIPESNIPSSAAAGSQSQ